MLLVNEVFGPTIQGEGPNAGANCIFLRLANCNQTCRWCDTPYTWAFTKTKAGKHQDGLQFAKLAEIHPMDEMAVFQLIKHCWNKAHSGRLIISGGEPMLQQANLLELIGEVGNLMRVDIETAGTLMPSLDLIDLVDTFVVSPKLANSGNAESVRYKPYVIGTFAHSANAYFKFVVVHSSDFLEIDDMVQMHEIDPRRVYIMPEGRTPQAVTEGARLIVDSTLARGYNLSLRSHVYIWGDARAH